MLSTALFGLAVVATTAKPKVLLFTKANAFVHDSIPAATEAITALGTKMGFDVVHSVDVADFTEANLKTYDVIVFANTTGDLFNDAQKDAFVKFMASGRGFVGVHAASDTEHHWDWYKRLVGAEFKRHPAAQKGTLIVEDKKHSTVKFIPEGWTHFDEWYEFTENPRPKVHVLASVDEKSYTDGRMGDHPVTWWQEYGGGRSWYTALGHPKEIYSDPIFLRTVGEGILWAAKGKRR